MCVKTREPKDEHCVSWCTYIHDPIPLDKLKKPHSTAIHNNTDHPQIESTPGSTTNQQIKNITCTITQPILETKKKRICPL